jgi:hypothetical protein
MYSTCSHFSNIFPSETVNLCDVVKTQYWQRHTKLIEVLDFKNQQILKHVDSNAALCKDRIVFPKF